MYSVFRYNPPSIGFAALSGTATQINGVDAPPPTATIGSISASATAGGGGGGSNVASRRWSVDWTPLVCIVAIAAGAAWM